MLERGLYGKTSDGKPVERFTLQNGNGLTVRFINYGCRILQVVLPLAEEPRDVVLGYGTLRQYEEGTSYLGAFVGRYANRIRGAAFALEDEEHALTRNDGNNYLHGSFHRRVFVPDTDGDAVVLSTVSPAGEDGFPGKLDVRVRYSLDDRNRFTMDYTARSDAPTHVNLTNHSYFDLSGGKEATVENHELRLDCRSFLEADAELCPTGRVLDVAGTAFDFLSPKRIGRDIESGEEQLTIAGGYDHCFLIDRGDDGRPLSRAAEASAPDGACRLTVYTTQPALQFYTGNFLGEAGLGKGGRPLSRRSGFCLETQHYPDTPHHSEFPSTLLRSGEIYRQITVWEFGWGKRAE